jgi:hypothetical protein
MDMVRHDTPGDQPIPLIVEVKQGFLHEGRDAWVPEPAGAMAGVPPIHPD